MYSHDSNMVDTVVITICFNILPFSYKLDADWKFILIDSDISNRLLHDCSQRYQSFIYKKQLLFNEPMLRKITIDVFIDSFY